MESSHDRPVCAKARHYWLASEKRKELFKISLPEGNAEMCGTSYISLQVYGRRKHVNYLSTCDSVYDVI